MIFFILALLVGIWRGCYQHYYYNDDFSDSALGALGYTIGGMAIAFMIVSFISLFVSSYDNFYYTPVHKDELIPIANEYYMTIEKDEGTYSKVYRVMVKNSDNDLTEELFGDEDFSFNFDDEACPTLEKYKSHFKYSWLKLFCFNFNGSYYIITLPANSIYSNINMEVLHE